MDEVKPIRLGARSLRLRRSAAYGHDLDPTIDLVEADLAFAIALSREEGGFRRGAHIGHLSGVARRRRLLVDENARSRRRQIVRRQCEMAS